MCCMGSVGSLNGMLPAGNAAMGATGERTTSTLFQGRLVVTERIRWIEW